MTLLPVKCNINTVLAVDHPVDEEITIFFVEIRSQCITQGGLQIGIFLPLLPKCWEYGHWPPPFTLGT